MPYYSVRVTENSSNEYIICAPNRDAVDDVLAKAIVAGKCDNKTIIAIRTDTDSSISVYDSDKTHWTESLKKKKAN